MTRRTPLYAGLPESAVPLRVQLLVAPLIPRWLATFIAEAASSGCVELDVVECEGLAPPPSTLRPGLAMRMFLAFERLVFRLLGRAAGRIPDGPMAMACAREVAGGRRIGCGAGTETLVRHVAETRPDLVILQGDVATAQRLAPLARHGCWVLDADLVQADHAGIALLVPMLRGEAVTETALHLVSVDGGSSRPLAASTGATVAMSYSRQRDTAFVKLPALLLRALRALCTQDEGGACGVGLLRTAPSGFTLPAGSGLASFAVALRQFLGWHGRRARSRQPWFVLLRDGVDRIDPDSPRLDRFTCLVAPGRDYWADPFPLVESGRRYLFVEEFVHARGKGIIVCLELLDDGSWARLGTVLDEDVHMSYPQVFDWEGERYLMVESCEAKRVSLYRCVEFPLRWERVADLIEGRECVDPTLYHQDGIWYLFANVSECGGSLSDELFLFHSRSLTGPYLPHPANPVLADARRSRPAGRMFLHEGRLIRPAQCCVPIYGAALVFNEVLELSPRAYRERPLSMLSPGFLPALDGCHTYSVAAGLEALDAHGVPPPQHLRGRLKGDGTGG